MSDQMTVPRGIGVKALRQLIASCELAEEKLKSDSRAIRRFKAEAKKALAQTLSTRGATVTYARRKRG